MRWRSHPDMTDTIIAVGVRGIYTISHIGGAIGGTWWLEGVGHDALPLWELTSSMRFALQEQARTHAARIDDTKVRESEVSGT